MKGSGKMEKERKLEAILIEVEGRRFISGEFALNFTVIYTVLTSVSLPELTVILLDTSTLIIYLPV
jgi:hypothetical protein